MYYKELEPDFQKYFKNNKNSKIKKIIKYSLEGGKCIRGFLVKHIMQTLSKKENVCWQPVVAIEILHAASLIIDDLPCMDNSEIRRKKKATFVEFGERESILTSFYMVSSSLKLLLEINQSIDKRKDLMLKLVSEWTELVGENLIVGQLLDLNENIQNLLNINKCVKNNTDIIIIYKTSSLFILSFLLGAIYSGVTDFDYESLRKWD
jgi:geranylgeranyl pyrophosphate synthase